MRFTRYCYFHILKTGLGLYIGLNKLKQHSLNEITTATQTYDWKGVVIGLFDVIE